ncbi:MAG: flagellar brake protein [Methylococcales bacterium]|nr:flagellar brake protein [Methylococcales bacterium]
MSASYQLSNVREVSKNLSLLVKHSTLLNLQIDAKHAFLTALVHIDTEKNLLIVDYAPNNELADKALSAKSLNFSGNYNGIDIAFITQGLRKGQFRKQPAFATGLPKSLYWRQRREFYRIRSPRHRHSYLLLNGADDEPQKLPLLDLSISGAALFCAGDIDPQIVQVGLELPEQQLVLDEIGSGQVSVKVVNQCPVNRNKEALGTRIGIQFTQLQRGMDMNIQRYIRMIERELLQKLDGN